MKLHTLRNHRVCVGAGHAVCFVAGEVKEVPDALGKLLLADPVVAQKDAPPPPKESQKK